MRELTPEEETRMVHAYRASGDCICSVCGKKYYNHKGYEPSALTTDDNHIWLNELCNGDLVKL